LPEFNSPEIEPYFDYSYGKGSYKKAKDKVSFALAPNLYKSSTSPLYDKVIHNLVISGKASLPQILNIIIADSTGQVPKEFANDPKAVKAAQARQEQLNKFPVTTIGGDAVQAASAYATTLFDEYAKLQSGFAQKLIEINPQFQDYRYNIPSSKTKYGVATNFKLGTIDVLNNDKALSKYNERKAQLSKNVKLTPAQVDAVLAKYKTFLAKDVNKAGRTPAKDEQQRRDRLAGK
jgi:hypothetical protein